VAAALRTLVISDLHLGNRAAHDVVRRPAPLARLVEALEGVDRLVLLGDTLELFSRHPRRSMAIAEPILRAIGRAAGPDRELIVVPGNHDGSLIRAWINAQGARLAPDSQVDPRASAALERLLSWLTPARTSVRYPGVWLDDRVWATHGHYLDRHLVPQSAFGLPRPRSPGRPDGLALPIDYERALRLGRRSQESLLNRALSRPTATLLETLAQFLRVTVPGLSRLLMNARLAPLTAGLIDLQMRYASLRAAGEVATRLGVEADWVIFGHVHRRGPVGDERWPTARSGARLLNTGSWVFDPVLLDRATPPHPYWPGGAVLVESGHPPRSVGLLDELSESELLGPGRRRSR
jgi:UDP-2,3-diacylglucosamine pyrophosphatase LpxH